MAVLGVAGAILIGEEEGVYSKYGFRFEYPEGVTISEEVTSGTVSWEPGPYDAVVLSWFASATWTAEDTEESISGGISGMETDGAVIDLIGDRETATMSGWDVTYQLFDITADGVKANGLIAVWYSEAGEKAFSFIALVTDDPLGHLEELLRSFESN